MSCTSLSSSMSLTFFYVLLILSFSYFVPVESVTAVFYNSSDCSASSLWSNWSLSLPSIQLDPNQTTSQCFNVSGLSNSYDSHTWLSSLQYTCSPGSPNWGLELWTYSIPCRGLYQPGNPYLVYATATQYPYSRFHAANSGCMPVTIGAPLSLVYSKIYAIVSCDIPVQNAASPYSSPTVYMAVITMILLISAGLWGSML